MNMKRKKKKKLEQLNRNYSKLWYQQNMENKLLKKVLNKKKYFSFSSVKTIDKILKQNCILLWLEVQTFSFWWEKLHSCSTKKTIWLQTLLLFLEGCIWQINVFVYLFTLIEQKLNNTPANIYKYTHKNRVRLYFCRR